MINIIILDLVMVQKLQEYLDDKVNVINLALSGRSSLSYVKEPEYQQLLKWMQTGDYLLIGFGHNDEKAEVDRHTSGCGSYKEDGSFAHSLYNHYIVKANKVDVRLFYVHRLCEEQIMVFGKTSSFI